MTKSHQTLACPERQAQRPCSSQRIRNQKSQVPGGLSMAGQAGTTVSGCQVVQNKANYQEQAGGQRREASTPIMRNKANLGRRGPWDFGLRIERRRCDFAKQSQSAGRHATREPDAGFVRNKANWAGRRNGKCFVRKGLCWILRCCETKPIWVGARLRYACAGTGMTSCLDVWQQVAGNRVGSFGR
jgi:hypothetical protein